MKIFVTGVAGQLGHDVMNELNKRGYEGVGSDLSEAYAGVADGSAVTTMPYVGLDITDQAAVQKAIEEAKPDVVIHCAAWTAVDAAEDEDKQATVRRVNVDGTRNIAEACKCDISQISVKATTEEKLGFTGEMLGISAHSVSLLVKI